MVKRRRNPAPDWVTPQIDDLLATIVDLESVANAERFFRDLCTIPELHTLAARWEVVKLLDQGVPYTEIAERTGASTATITRINTWRRYGTGGYRMQLDRRKARSR
ncbi:MAG TPA: YerC/YecD family TrpR-related protein [Candidatus Dormibacteraeota bacterium]|jgi:TrpR-related protein YerC/YecD|nr:YerC/YecD family TrpR-related protein [Candidatus Dormibacteraeota bacterium]